MESRWPIMSQLPLQEYAAAAAVAALFVSLPDGEKLSTSQIVWSMIPALPAFIF